MKYVYHTLRILLAVVLLGLMAVGGYGFMPAPTPEMYPSVEGWNFIKALMDTGYMMPVMATFSLIAGLMFLFNRYVAFAAVLMAPITVNIIAFHWFLDPMPISPGSIPAYVLLVLNVYFLWINKKKYEPMFA